MLAMRINTHNAWASGEKAGSDGKKRKWHLNYIFEDSKTKSNIETSLSREMDIEPTKEALALLDRVKFLLPNITEFYGKPRAVITTTV